MANVVDVSREASNVEHTHRGCGYREVVLSYFLRCVLSVCVLGVLMVTQAAAMPDWCRRASLNPTEQTVCSEGALMFLDERLNKTYQRALRDNPGRQSQIRKAQRGWKQVRDSCGVNIMCIDGHYNDQLTYLEGLHHKAAVQPAGAAPSCRQERQLRSIDSGLAVAIRFVNVSGTYRSLYWIDFNGKAVQYQGLNPGQSYVQQTFVGHPWMATDGPGDCKQIFVPQQGGGQITVELR